QDATWRVELECSTDAWKLVGECYLQMQDFDKALQALQAASDKSEDPALHIRLGSVLLVKKRWKQARDTFLRSIQFKPTAEAWSGVAYAELRSDDLRPSYEALCEANLLDNERCDVWALLCLV
ncbi:Cilia- and flagella-associated protein 70 (Tetratricopeptide repeat protein 18) (TPR repeat protein 18), partial [Durusdinium trenchii]